MTGARRVGAAARLLVAAWLMVPAADASAQHGAGMPAMDHGGMRMQGGPAPADARDPHAYSGGTTLDSGDYALPGPRQLRMADEHRFGAVRLDRLERVDSRDASATAFDAQAWIGSSYDRIVISSEGRYLDGRIEDSNSELLWSHAVGSYWDGRAGIRHDSGEGPDRSWLALGLQGLAPYWFELKASAYLGAAGRSAVALEAEYELLITQRLVLQPRLEAEWFGTADDAKGRGSGLAEAAAGLRLRYEITRRLAPYLGVEWSGSFGGTADRARAEDSPTRETRYLLGLRAWF